MSLRSPYQRGTVWQVRLEPVEGSEQGGIRPTVVISANTLNDVLPVITVAVITSRKTARVYPTEVLVEPPEGGLTQRSKVLLYQTRTISKRRVLGQVGALTAGTMTSVDAALRRALSV
jgi:mRNA interferase MazF